MEFVFIFTDQKIVPKDLHVFWKKKPILDEFTYKKELSVEFIIHQKLKI